MIFVTVGEQLPFDRLVRAMDEWALQSGQDVFAQIGGADFEPQNIKYKRYLNQREFFQKMEEAQLVVAHAGMGTIISALELAKPLIIMPRRAAYGEHRNDHQLATATRFASLGTVTLVTDKEDLFNRLAAPLSWRPLGDKDGEEATRLKGPSPELMKTIRDFICSE